MCPYRVIAEGVAGGPIPPCFNPRFCGCYCFTENLKKTEDILLVLDTQILFQMVFKTLD